MLRKLKTLLSRDESGPGPARANARSRTNARNPAVSAGERVFAIGDIHGRLDLFEEMLDLIESDDAGRSSAHTTIVLLGDLIDRGPDSAGVLTRTRKLAQERNVEILQGNHEEMFLLGRKQLSVFKQFLKYGGRETLLSYGVDPAAIARNDSEELQDLMVAAVPWADFDFIEGFANMVRIGDYLFVHAGIRPSTPLEMQIGQDCRWIREPFLSDTRDYGVVVVHGHTITGDPVVRANRIGIDTGAFRSGALTALGLQGTDRWFLQTRAQACGTIEAVSIPANALAA